MLRPALLASALLLTACDAAKPPRPATLPTEVEAATPACKARRFEGTSFTVCPYDARRHALELIVADDAGTPLRSLARLEQALGRRARRVRFAMNAGMYDDAGRPIGLFVSAGETGHVINLRRGSGNFHLLPNGVFAVDRAGRVSITESRRWSRATSRPRWATQSGPMLVIGGKLHPRFHRDGPSRLVRNGVGVRDRATAFFVISDDPVSFGRFARFFRDALACPDALYLDGSVSSLWDPGAGRQDGYDQLGPMVMISRR